MSVCPASPMPGCLPCPAAFHLESWGAGTGSGRAEPGCDSRAPNPAWFRPLQAHDKHPDHGSRDPGAALPRRAQEVLPTRGLRWPGRIPRCVVSSGPAGAAYPPCLALRAGHASRSHGGKPPVGVLSLLCRQDETCLPLNCVGPHSVALGSVLPSDVPRGTGS